MAGETQEAPWPITQFYFRVTFGDRGAIVFQEVSGLDREQDIVEYRAGNNPSFRVAHTPPGERKAADITLTKGLVETNTELFDYFAGIQMDHPQRETVTIQLLDETGSPMMSWTLANAWPTQITGTDLAGEHGEMAIEKLVLTHEGITMG